MFKMKNEKQKIPHSWNISIIQCSRINPTENWDEIG
jgi:hypothetical protein